MEIREEDWKVCCGSSDFAKLMVKASPFNSLDAAIESARDIWFNQVNVAAWLEAFAAHPLIGKSPSPSSNSDFARRSVTEQSRAFATTSASALEVIGSDRISTYLVKVYFFLMMNCLRFLRSLQSGMHSTEKDLALSSLFAPPAELMPRCSLS